ncbi:hypothetical protein GGI43DRAFT_387902 [Trichoderma evansii]
MSSRYPKDDYPYAASDIVPIGLKGNAGPGILAVTLHEVAGFPTADEVQENEAKAARPTRISFQSKVKPYAVLDFDKSIVFVKPSSGTIQSPLWRGSTGSAKFDVFNPAELTVRLYIENSDKSEANQDLFVGSVRIRPMFMEAHTSSAEWFQSAECTGKMRITLE